MGLRGGVAAAAAEKHGIFPVSFNPSCKIELPRACRVELLPAFGDLKFM